MLAFAFGLSLVFDTYVGHCILSFLSQEKKKIDLLNKYGKSINHDEHLHSLKKKSVNGMNMT